MCVGWGLSLFWQMWPSFVCHTIYPFLLILLLPNLLHPLWVLRMSRSLLLFPVACPLDNRSQYYQRLLHTHKHACVICPVTLQTACALLACDELWYSRGWNRATRRWSLVFCCIFCLLYLLELPPLGESWYYRDRLFLASHHYVADEA